MTQEESIRGLSQIELWVNFLLKYKLEFDFITQEPDNWLNGPRQVSEKWGRRLSFPGDPQRHQDGDLVDLRLRRRLVVQAKIRTPGNNEDLNVGKIIIRNFIWTVDEQGYSDRSI